MVLPGTLGRAAAVVGIGPTSGLTAVAEALLAKRGCQRIDRAEMPEAVRAAAEFRGLFCTERTICPRKAGV